MYTKSVAYEPSLHVPLIAVGPGIAPGRSSDALVELIDLNPTICELAGLPAQENIDAVSFAPVLQGRRDSHRTEAVSALTNFRAIRTDRYKFVQNLNDAPELYDLREDPHELRNLAGDLRDEARDLSARMHERFMEGQWRR